MCSGNHACKQLLRIARFRRIAAILSLGLACFMGTGCKPPEQMMAKLEEAKKKAEEEKKAEEARIIIPVEARHPHRDSVSAYFETTTRVLAEERVDIMSQGIGDCLEIFVEEGDKVEKGDILAELDKDEARASLNQTEVQVRKQQSDYLRSKKMFEEGLLSKAEYDNARFAYEQGLAGLKMQREQFDNLTIRSPLDGVVTNRNVNVGQLVTSGVPVFSVVDPNSYILTINPPEKELYRLKVGQVAEVTIDAAEGRTFEAKVRRINPAVDPASGTVKVTLDVDKEARNVLREAAFARVRLVMETHDNALLVPKDAVIEENARKYLFLVEEQSGADEAKSTDETKLTDEASTAEASDDPSAASEAAASEAAAPEAAAPEAESSRNDEGTKTIAKRIEVQTGLENSDFVEILSGIDDNSLVITLGQQTLKPGSEIKVTTAEAELAAKKDMPIEEALQKAEEERESSKGKAENATEDNSTTRRRRGRRM